MTALQEKLFAMADEKYAAFQAKLAPTVDARTCIGVRLPELRQFARDFEKTPECAAFLEAPRHEYYDENILHAVLLGRIRDFDRCLALTEKFLPYVDNWAVCDTIRPAVFAKHKVALLPHVRRWSASEATYTCRFGLDMLMTYYLDEAFTPEFPEIAARAESKEYYVRMMVAWYFATALAKQWDTVIPYIESRRLPEWTHRKAIQKARESFRITDEQKEYLRTLT